jgi:hypothetical protein
MRLSYACRRRRGIVRALTTDAEQFCQLCAPEKENLTLFAFPGKVLTFSRSEDTWGVQQANTHSNMAAWCQRQPSCQHLLGFDACLSQMVAGR